ncbi:MAG: hypothetical protein DRI54_06210 [Bacteroidetes bacterium]|nr:MAG: hypothetical protein DRI54_06210 [Bacteroidota bacterium]
MRLSHFINIIILIFLVACNNGQVIGNGIDKSISTDETIQQSTVVSLNTIEWHSKLQSDPGSIIDIRTPDEWRSGYIEDADFANIFDKDFITQVNIIQEKKNKPLYIYCRSGNRSKEAMRVLSENGYTHVYELNKGILDWQKEGYSITK